MGGASRKRDRSSGSWNLESNDCLIIRDILVQPPPQNTLANCAAALMSHGTSRQRPRPSISEQSVFHPAEGAAGFYFHKRPINYLIVGSHVGKQKRGGRAIRSEAGPARKTRYAHICVWKILNTTGTKSGGAGGGAGLKLQKRLQDFKKPKPAKILQVKMYFSVALSRVQTKPTWLSGFQMRPDG